MLISVWKLLQNIKVPVIGPLHNSSVDKASNALVLAVLDFTSLLVILEVNIPITGPPSALVKLVKVGLFCAREVLGWFTRMYLLSASEPPVIITRIEVI